MTSNRLTSLTSPQRLGQLALLFWASITLLLLRHDPYGLDEGAAKALLLCWSIADQVANSVITFGTPDLRTLLFLPTGFLWTGNVFAAKVLSVAIFAYASQIFYLWQLNRTDSESSLLASGLFLVSPLTISQLDSLSPGIYLLSAFAIGSFLNVKYSSEPRTFGGIFFAQLLVCAFTVSLHPAGLAYPISLLWNWRKEHKKQRYFIAATTFVAIFTVALRMGWSEMNWLNNPANILAQAVFGNVYDETGLSSSHLLTGYIVLILLIGVVVSQYRRLRSDFTGQILMLSMLFGAFSADSSWGLIALAIILYFGLPILLRPGEPATQHGFMLQRGWILFLVFICLTLFMRADRLQYDATIKGILSAQDQLIKTLAVETEAEQQSEAKDDSQHPSPRLIVASQWPSRTMIACKCDTLPLPPATKNPQDQLNNLKGITYLLFDPKQTENLNLARNLSMLSEATETASLQAGGVLLHVRKE